MAHRLGLDRFKKAQSSEPFNINTMGAKQSQLHPARFQIPTGTPESVGAPGSSGHVAANADSMFPKSHATAVGAGNSTWQPPDWAADPKPGMYSLEVQKDGKVVDTINLEKKRTIFGRQAVTCDLVLDHPSLSRQHAAVVPHKNGRVFVIDMGSVHGTFVSNERVPKDSPMELEPGQSLRFAASTRVYILRKADNRVPLFAPEKPLPIQLPPPPDGNDPESVVAYNTMLNRLGVASPLDEAQSGRARGSGTEAKSRKRKSLSEYGEAGAGIGADEAGSFENPAKRARNVRFRDQCGGELATVVGFSDGADISTEPGPMGVKEGSSLKGKFDSLVHTTIIPKRSQEVKTRLAGGMEPPRGNSSGVTDNLKEYLSRVRSPGGKGGLYGGLFGEASPAMAGGSWGGTPVSQQPGREVSEEGAGERLSGQQSIDSAHRHGFVAASGTGESVDMDDDDDDLFGERSVGNNGPSLREPIGRGGASFVHR